MLKFALKSSNKGGKGVEWGKYMKSTIMVITVEAGDGSFLLSFLFEICHGKRKIKYKNT